ncbi:MAG: hypothetical protein JRN37_07555 [Nitrososphaerota archaeon]|jgi:hypothetical protein|nr:hypothetical protein [Nitrososphaerota archaeon]MDG7038988.1 hypothetical protein [Nitrososphaerota archaeon]
MAQGNEESQDKFYILWLDDNKDGTAPYISRLGNKTNVGEKYYKFEIKQVENLRSASEELRKGKYYDMLVVDWNLSDKEKGDAILNEVTGQYTYTHCIFYSRLPIKNKKDHGLVSYTKAEGLVSAITERTFERISNFGMAYYARGIVLSMYADLEESIDNFLADYLDPEGKLRFRECFLSDYHIDMGVKANIVHKIVYGKSNNEKGAALQEPFNRLEEESLVEEMLKVKIRNIIKDRNTVAHGQPDRSNQGKLGRGKDKIELSRERILGVLLDIAEGISAFTELDKCLTGTQNGTA